MFRKWKLLAAAAVMAVSVLVPSVFAYAVEVSGTTVEVPGGEKKHTVVAYGKSVAIVYAYGKTEIIANNSSGRIDVMIDGKVTKGIGTVVIPAQNGTNMVLENGSFIVNGVTDSQADTLKRMVADGLAADSPVASAAVIESGDGMQGARAFSIGAKGELFASDGSAAPASALPEMEVKTPEVVYQAFAEEMEENIRIEQEAAQRAREEEAAAKAGEEQGEDAVADKEEEVTEGESSGNGVTGMCVHEWEPDDTKILFLGSGPESGYEACATPPFFRCTKCGILMWRSENKHMHGEDYCEYCGFNIHGKRKPSSECEGGGEHVFEDKVLPSSSMGPIMPGDHKSCWTGLIHFCTKCDVVDTTDATQNIHGEDYCQYCGYNQNGESGTPNKCKDGGEHTYKDINIPEEETSIILEDDYKQCWSGIIHQCTKCYAQDLTDAVKHEHGEDYCQYCGYNQNGERNS